MDTVGEDLDYTIPPLVAACLAAARRTRRGAPITALDAGCGAGKWLRLLDAEEVYGVDCAEKLVALARRAAPGAHFIVADLAVLR